MTSKVGAFICYWCKHYDNEVKNRTCTAFPEGIPEEIFENEFDHREPYEGDNGIQFEKQPNPDLYPHSLQINRGRINLDIMLQMLFDSINEEDWKYDPERYPLERKRK